MRRQSCVYFSGKPAYPSIAVIPNGNPNLPAKVPAFRARSKGGAAPFIFDMPDGFLGHGRRFEFQHQQIAAVAVNALDAELRLAGGIAHKNTQAGDLIEILATTARALHHGHSSKGARDYPRQD